MLWRFSASVERRSEPSRARWFIQQKMRPAYEAAELGHLAARLVPTGRITFNGLLLSWNAVATVGFPRSDFFVGQEDADYYRRLRRMGVPIHRVDGAVLAHHGKGRRRRGEDESLIRRAYSKRNSSYRDAMIDGHPARAVLRLAGHAARSCRPGSSHDRVLMRAVRDGLVGRLGTFDSATVNGPDD